MLLLLSIIVKGFLESLDHVGDSLYVLSCLVYYIVEL
jgi:hypothetical protein